MRPSVEAVEIPGPVLLWSPDRQRFLVVEELTPADPTASRGNQRGRLWLFAPDAETGFAGHPLPVELSYDEAAFRAHPSRRAPRWLGDGTGIVFETRDGTSPGRSLHLHDLESGRTSLLVRGDDGRPHTLAATVPHSRSVLLYREVPGADGQRGLAWLDAPVDSSAPGAPRTVIEEGVHLSSFAPDGLRMAVVREDPEVGFRLHVLDCRPGSSGDAGRGVPISDVGHLSWSPDGHTLAVGVLEPDRQELPHQGHLLLRVTSSNAMAVDRQMDPERDHALLAWHPDGRHHLRSSTDRRAALGRIFGAPAEEPAAPGETATPPEIEGSFLRRALVRGVVRLMERTVRREMEKLEGPGERPPPSPTSVEWVGDDGSVTGLLEMDPADAVAWLGCSPDGRWAAARIVRSTGACELLAMSLEGDPGAAARSQMLGEADPDGPEVCWIGEGATLAWSSHAGEARELRWTRLG